MCMAHKDYQMLSILSLASFFLNEHKCWPTHSPQRVAAGKSYHYCARLHIHSSVPRKSVTPLTTFFMGATLTWRAYNLTSSGVPHCNAVQCDRAYVV